jgi:hypothetical protein
MEAKDSNFKKNSIPFVECLPLSNNNICIHVYIQESENKTN